MGKVSRGGFLRQVGAGAVGAAVGVALPATAWADDDQDRANVRLVAASKRLTITWYTRWLAAPAARSADTIELVRELRRQEESHYHLLAPVLGATAPVDDDFTFTLPKSALASSSAAVDFAVQLER